MNTNRRQKNVGGSCLRVLQGLRNFGFGALLEELPPCVGILSWPGPRTILGLNPPLEELSEGIEAV